MAMDFLSYVVLCMPAQLVCCMLLACTKCGGNCSFMWIGSRF
jgi:hypothetical protein